jgi:hypothetical protein
MTNIGMIDLPHPHESLRQSRGSDPSAIGTESAIVETCILPQSNPFLPHGSIEKKQFVIGPDRKSSAIRTY